MTDREQAVSDLTMACGNHRPERHVLIEYGVAQRERVIQLERALREPITPAEWSAACPKDTLGKTIPWNGIGIANRILDARRAALGDH